MSEKDHEADLRQSIRKIFADHTKTEDGELLINAKGTFLIKVTTALFTQALGAARVTEILYEESRKLSGIDFGHVGEGETETDE
jgi:fluoride ion exporter CrcB/FEX